MEGSIQLCNSSSISKFILPRVPRFRTKFLAYIDQSAKLHDQRVSMDFELLRSQDDPSHSFRRSDNQLPGNRGDHFHPSHPPSPSSPHTTVTNCHRIGLHRPEICPVIDHMLSLCLDHEIHPDKITEDDSKDLDFYFEEQWNRKMGLWVIYYPLLLIQSFNLYSS